MKSLIVVPEFPPDSGGGIITYYAALVPELVSAGHEVTVAVGSDTTSDGRRAMWGGANVMGLEYERYSRWLASFTRYGATPRVKRYLAAAWALHEMMGGGADYDVVQVVDWGLMFVPWVVEPGPPCIIDLHGSSGQIGLHEPQHGEAHVTALVHLLERALIGSASCIRAHSRANQSFWATATGREVSYSHPPVRMSGVKPDGHRSNEGFVAARLQAWKGPDVLCEALTLLGSDAPLVRWAGRAVLHPASETPYDQFLRDSYPEVWGDRFVWMGQIPPQQVEEWQRSADFVVVPSTWDVFNLTVTESMAAGSIVICSDGAGAVDVLEDGQSGFVFPAGDAPKLADAIRRVGSLDGDAKERIRRRARESIVEKLDPGRVAADLILEYERTSISSVPEVPEELVSMVRPATTGRGDAFLDHLPLLELARYCVKRTYSKIRGTSNVESST